MISDTISDALHEIEEYQRSNPEWHDALAEHIEIVKKVMASLMNRLDEVPVEEYAFPQSLSEDEKEWWRVTCEANVARWFQRLCLLEPVSKEQLIERLDNAIERQEALLEKLKRTKCRGRPSAIRLWVALPFGGGWSYPNPPFSKS